MRLPATLPGEAWDTLGPTTTRKLRLPVFKVKKRQEKRIATCRATVVARPRLVRRPGIIVADENL
jgi:hypothetical protein